MIFPSTGPTEAAVHSDTVLRTRKFRRVSNIVLLAVFGIVLLGAGDVTARVIGLVFLVWAAALVVLWRRHIWFLFAANRDRQ